MVQLPTNTTFLCGAGVSQGSGLPDGQALAALAFDHVWAGANVYPAAAQDAVRDALRWRPAGEPHLRLELILDLMAKEIDASVLAGIYSVLLGASPCLAHRALATAGMPIVTTNQDELIEDAAIKLGATVDVMHLHGLASRPQSIVTMLSQYVDGLSSPIAQQLQDRITACHLVVLGYSGRDLDIMPHLYRAPRVTWLHFQPSGGGPPPATEVRALHDFLGSRMRIVAHPDPVRWLLDRLPAAAKNAALFAAPAGRAVTASPRLSGEASRAFAALPLVQRRLAIARVLLHVDQADFVYEGLIRAARSHPRDAGIQLRIADALVLLQRRPQALRRYARASALTSQPAVRASALLDSAHTRANSSQYEPALEELAEADSAAQAVKDTRERTELRGRIAAMQARIYGMSDDEDRAIRLYKRAEIHAEKCGNLDLRVTSLVFGSDMLRSRGRYREALANLARVFDDNELYGRPYTRVWGRFYRGMTLCAMGQLGDGLPDLEACRTAATASGNQQANAWASVALASYLRCMDLDAAQRAIGDCEAAIRAYRGPMIMCDVRLAWERAELARARGDDREALQRVRALRKRLQHPSFPVKMPYMTPHMLALEGEIARGRGDPAARSILREARELFAAGRWSHGVARIDVSLWLMSGRIHPPAPLLRKCRDAGYGTEVHRLTIPGPLYYPLHMI
jgi:tetratricopeptide (TPR) repeat protein